MNSIETTAIGILGIVSMLSTALWYQFDGDPATVPDWELVIGMLLVNVGLIRSRDNNKTSEDVGAA